MTLTLETTFGRRHRGRSLVIRVLQAITTALYRAHRRRVTEKALSKLDDRELEDIGVTRTSRGYILAPWHPDRGSSDWRYHEKR
ncbi:DUF1127 domain-containing protein [uncultured Roseibium sp.]|uniref:DUF1127 domain-containing protein n=1 Tax=uncultured Roseibium sp. TaxID=1936171 RepID=UPI003217DBA3